MGALERKTSMKITNDMLKKLIKEVIEEKITAASNKGDTLEETRGPRVDPPSTAHLTTALGTPADPNKSMAIAFESIYKRLDIIEDEISSLKGGI